MQHRSNQKKTYITKSGIKVRLTPQQKAYADAKIEASPTKSKVQIIKDINTDVTNGTARQLVNQYEGNKDIAIYSQEQISMAKTTIVDLASNGKKEETRMKASQDILDRTEGKAVQRQITTNTNLNLNIEANKDLADAFTAFMKASTKQ